MLLSNVSATNNGAADEGDDSLKSFLNITVPSKEAQHSSRVMLSKVDSGFIAYSDMGNLSVPHFLLGYG